MANMREKFLIFGSPSIEQPEIDEVEKVLQSGWLGTGPKVERFEKAFSSYNAMNDYGIFSLVGFPRQEQGLEEVQALLMEEIEMDKVTR